jgi:hypothetical protein
VIRPARVPEQRAGDRTTRNARADHVRAIGDLLGVDARPVLDRSRCVGGDHDGRGGDFAPAVQPDDAAIVRFFRISPLHFDGPVATEDAPAVALDAADEGGKILQGVENALPPEAKAWSGIERVQRRGARKLLHIGDANELGGVELDVERLLGVALVEEEESIDAGEVAVDLLLTDDGFDAIDRSGVAFVGELGSLLSMRAIQLGEPVVDGTDEVGAGAAGLPIPRRSLADQDHGFAFALEQVCGRQSRDARADDAHVCVHVCAKGRDRGDVGVLRPDRRRSAVGEFHSGPCTSGSLGAESGQS